LDDESLVVPKKMLEYGAMKLREPEEVFEFLPSQDQALEVVQ